MTRWRIHHKIISHNYIGQPIETWNVVEETFHHVSHVCRVKKGFERVSVALITLIYLQILPPSFISCYLKKSSPLLLLPSLEISLHRLLYFILPPVYLLQYCFGSPAYWTVSVLPSL